MEKWYRDIAPMKCFTCARHVPVFVFYPWHDYDGAADGHYCKRCIDSFTWEDWNDTKEQVEEIRRERIKRGLDVDNLV